jgi:hypothetical protein
VRRAIRSSVAADGKNIVPLGGRERRGKGSPG